MFDLDVPHGSRLPAVDPAWLDETRIDGRYPFPQSYKEFARKHGHGRALGLLIIYAPSGKHPGSILVQAKRVRGFIRMAIEQKYMEYEPDGSEEIAKRLFPFAASENGEYFAWDLQLSEPVERNAPVEYLIYCLGTRMASMRFAAKNLDELMRRLTSNEVKNILGPGYSPLPKTFQPLD